MNRFYSTFQYLPLTRIVKKNNIFLNVGVAAGLVGLGLIAPAPVLGTALGLSVLGGLVIGGLAAVETVGITAMHVTDYVTDNAVNLVGKKIKSLRENSKVSDFPEISPNAPKRA